MRAKRFDLVVRCKGMNVRIFQPQIVVHFFAFRSQIPLEQVADIAVERGSHKSAGKKEAQNSYWF